MRKALPLALVVCFFAMPCLAFPDNVAVDPYMVYFDLGLSKSDYMIEVSEPVIKEDLNGDTHTDYGFMIRSRVGMTRVINFMLFYNKNNTVLPSESDMQLMIDLGMNQMPGAMNVQTATRPVDDTFGGVASYDYGTSIGNVKMYGLSYFPVSQNGTLLVTVVSTYPWESGTLQLFRTLHVERVFTPPEDSDSKEENLLKMP